MRRIAPGGALIASLLLLAGCGQHHNTRQYATAGGPVAAQPPTLIQGGLDPEVRVARDGEPLDGPSGGKAKLPNSVTISGSLEDGYRDSPSPDF